jgi:hypothetical protein
VFGSAEARLALALSMVTLSLLVGCGGPRFVPVAAHVAIELRDEGVARTGRIEVAPSTDFKIHAVLEARTEEGEVRYYSDVAGLELYGERVAPELVQSWDGPRFAQVLWLTLEAQRRYAEITSARQLEGFRFDGFARPEWGRGWIAEARMGLRSEELLDVHAGSDVMFGTRFLQAWVELSDQRDAILPQERFKSPGPEVLLTDPERVTTLVIRSPGALGSAERVFGLSQLEPAPELDESTREAIRSLHDRGLAFNRIELLRDLTNDSGQPFSELDWSLVELGQGVRWGQDIFPGDLLRAGDRWIVVFDDTQGDGLLDASDRCLDFDRGAGVENISEVFVGEGELQLARLGSTARAELP